jgi:hypothetical protein
MHKSHAQQYYRNVHSRGTINKNTTQIPSKQEKHQTSVNELKLLLQLWIIRQIFLDILLEHVFASITIEGCVNLRLIAGIKPYQNNQNMQARRRIARKPAINYLAHKANKTRPGVAIIENGRKRTYNTISFTLIWFTC